MGKFFLSLCITALAVLAAGYFVPDISVSSPLTALLMALLLGLINLFVRPVLVLLTLPINIMTLGLFTLVLNGLLFWFASSFLSGISVGNFKAAFTGALLVSFASWIGNSFINRRE